MDRMYSQIIQNKTGAEILSQQTRTDSANTIQDSGLKTRVPKAVPVMTPISLRYPYKLSKIPVKTT